MIHLQIYCSSVFRSENDLPRPKIANDAAELGTCLTNAGFGSDTYKIALPVGDRRLSLESLSHSKAMLNSNELISINIPLEDSLNLKIGTLFNEWTDPIPNGLLVTVDHFTLYLFEHSVLIIEFVTSLESEQASLEFLDSDILRRIETQINTVAQVLLDQITPRYLRFIKQIQARFKMPEQLKFFPNFMWTSRTAILTCADNEAQDFHFRWAEATKPKKKFDDESFYLISWGNSSLFGTNHSQTIKVFEEIKRKLQFIYTVVFILREQNSTFFSDLIDKRDQIKEASIRRLRDQEVKLFQMENFLSELDHFYQGSRYSVFKEFVDEWRLSGLIDDLYKKIERANKLLSYIYYNKRSRVQNLMKSILIAIGTIEVLGVFTDLIELSNSDELHTQQRYGIVAFLYNCNAGILLTLLSFLLFIFAFLILRSGLQERDVE